MSDFAASYEAHDVEVNGRALRAYRTGGDKPQVVYVHGYTDSALSAKMLIDELKGDYDVIAYDSRGHGASTRIDQPYTIVDLADDLAGLIDAMQLDRPIGIGHSMGAATVLLAAARYPRHMRAIVAEDPPLAPVTGSRDMNLWKNNHIALVEQGLDAITAAYRGQYAKWREEDILTRAKARHEFDVTVFDQMKWQDSPDWHDWAGDIQCPGLLLAGNAELGGIAISPYAEEFVSLWENGELVKFTNVGHQIRCEQPQAYAETVLPFLAKHS